MADLPADVDERYRQLARQRNWPPDVEAAFRASVAWIRGLDEGSGPRSYYERVDDVGFVDQGARWLWETVSIDGAIVAVKQIEEPAHGPARRYSWRCLEDEDGGLTDQELSPAEDGLTPVAREVLYEVWERGER